MSAFPLLRPSLLAVSAAFLLGCGPSGAPALDDADRARVAEMVALARARLLRYRDPEAARAALDSLQVSFPIQGPESPLAHLWQDPERGRLFLQAVHDSLQALRSELFPTSGEESKLRVPPRHR